MSTFPAPGQPPTTALDSTTSNEHSVLVLKKVGEDVELYKFGVDADGAFETAPVAAADTDGAKRLAFSVAGATMPRGPVNETKDHVAFGILPIKADPTSAHYSCHLVNADLLFPKNAWTRGPWNAPPLATHEVPLSSAVLLATPNGLVVRVDPNGTQSIQHLDKDPAVWRLLRNGCVVGMVQLNGETGLIPLINLAAFTGAAAASTSTNVELEGTWDFKWPRKSNIRIRVDPPSAAGRTAEAWTGGPPPGLSPDAKDAAIAKTLELAHLWLSSASLTGALTLERVPPGGEDYDVLINLDPLAAAGPISAPQSDLGTYCQRRPLNEPTSYCGHPEGLKGEDGVTIENYYSSPAFTHILLHELGHVFGLPHLHQHPGNTGRIIQERYDAGLGTLIRDVVGLNVDEATLNTDMREKWPGKADKYAEWPKLPTGQGIGVLAEASIMMGHPIRGILEGDSGDPRLQFLSEPGSNDIAWIRMLYA